MAGLMVPPRFRVSVETFMRISFHLIHSASELRSPPSLGGPVRGARSRVARPYPTRVVELTLFATAGVGSPAPSRVDSPFQAGAARRSWRLAPVLWGLPSCNLTVYTSTTLCNVICRDFSTAQRETCSDLGKRRERNLGRGADSCRKARAHTSMWLHLPALRAPRSRDAVCLGERRPRRSGATTRRIAGSRRAGHRSRLRGQQRTPPPRPGDPALGDGHARAGEAHAAS